MAHQDFNWKDLTMDSWLDSILDGRKGDVLTLQSLCMLTEFHVLVHLKGGKIWTSLKKVPSSHTLIMQQVNLHSVYLGCGNFAKLSMQNATSSST